MIIREEKNRREQLLSVAKAMMTAIRTAPKARGVDNIETCVVEGDTLLVLANKMREIGEKTGMAFFLRDAESITNSLCVVLVGAKQLDYGLNCGLCGYASCADRNKGNPNTPCAFANINQGIAIGSAVSVAADNRVDNRIMYSAGVAARELSLIADCNNILAIPLSCTAKSIYFDRQ